MRWKRNSRNKFVLYIPLSSSAKKIVLQGGRRCVTIKFMTEKDRQTINELIVGISRGDEFALDALSCLVSARMLSVAQSVTRDRAVAEEVVQDSFVRIYRNASRFRRGTNGYAWICKITQNVALNRLRSEKRNMTVNIDDFFYLASDDNVEEQSVAELTVRQALSALQPFEQRVIYQKYFMDLSVRDIADSLGKSRSAVSRAILSGEEKIKNFLKSGTKPV